MKKLKEIMSAHNLLNDQLGLIFLLFKQINLDASFSNSQKLFNHLGLSSTVSNSKLQLFAIKDLSIK